MFVKKSEAAKQLNLTIAELDIILTRRGIKRVSDSDVKQIKAQMEAQGIAQKLESSTAGLPKQVEEVPITEPESKQVEQEPVPQPEAGQESAIKKRPDEAPISLDEHQQQTKEALEIAQKGFSEQNLNDAIALGTLDGIQKVALRLQSARKMELDLLAKLSQANQQTTQSQLNQAKSLFNDLMHSQNGQLETLGKSQIAAHKHSQAREDAITQAQTLMQSMI